MARALDVATVELGRRAGGTAARQGDPRARQAGDEALPANQRAVISLRDIEGWDADEAVTSLGVSETNQRVLLAPRALEGTQRTRVLHRRRGPAERRPVEQLSCQEIVELITGYLRGCARRGRIAPNSTRTSRDCEGCRKLRRPDGGDNSGPSVTSILRVSARKPGKASSPRFAAGKAS